MTEILEIRVSLSQCGPKPARSGTVDAAIRETDVAGQ